MEIENKLTVTKGGGGGGCRGKGEGSSKNMYEGPVDKAKRDRIEGGAGGSGGGKMATTVLEQQ